MRLVMVKKLSTGKILSDDKSNCELALHNSPQLVGRIYHNCD